VGFTADKVNNIRRATTNMQTERKYMDDDEEEEMTATEEDGMSKHLRETRGASWNDDDDEEKPVRPIAVNW
jgi:hypothetical protein